MKLLYDSALKANGTVLSLVGHDIQTNEQRVITFCHPIYVKENLHGAIFWEVKVQEAFEKFIVPQSY